MMTKETSDLKKGMISLISLPVLFGLLMLMGKTAYTQATAPQDAKEQLSAAAKYYKNATIILEKDDGDRVYKNFAALSAEEQASIPMPPPPPPVPGGTNTVAVHQPLPEGTVVYVKKNGSIKVGTRANNAEGIPPPPPPVHSSDIPTPQPPPPTNAPAPPPPPPHSPATMNVLPPPPPVAPSEYVEDMINENAIFKYKGKTITSERAREIVSQKSNKLAIKTTTNSNGKKVVLLKN